MRALRVLAVFLLSLSLLAGCDDDDDSTSDAAAGDTTVTTEEVNDIVVFGPDDDGTEVDVATGSSFDVALVICRGSGYSWQVVTEPDTAVLSLTGQGDTEPPQVTDENGAPMVGGMGEHVFHYEVVGEGIATIELGYVPPAGGEPEETFTLTVNIAA